MACPGQGSWTWYPSSDPIPGTEDPWKTILPTMTGSGRRLTSSQMRTSAACGKTRPCHRAPAGPHSQKYPATRVQVGLSDSYMLEQVQALLQQQKKRM
jgi:hypothetical protein